VSRARAAAIVAAALPPIRRAIMRTEAQGYVTGLLVFFRAEEKRCLELVKEFPDNETRTLWITRAEVYCEVIKTVQQVLDGINNSVDS
jgi:hypothetical protein